jgi:hypothetical protein
MNLENPEEFIVVFRDGGFVGWLDENKQTVFDKFMNENNYTKTK